MERYSRRDGRGKEEEEGGSRRRKTRAAGVL